MTPNKEHLRLWIEDLESGKHPQARGFMGIDGDPASYCCLGRLCEVAIENGVGVIRENMDNTEDEDHQPIVALGYEGEYGSFVPLAVTNWLGLSSPDDLTGYAVRNDDGASFKQIAAALREHFSI